ncbi:MAG: nucleotidyl transferase [Chlorobi bacterium CHB2]|nr:nucleotidyl transferase [Chlorobi bacterium CHB2]
MRAIIPVAGVGSRLRPHTYTLPKVLLNVAGKPILGHILDRLIAEGISAASIVVGYLGEMVEEYVRKNYQLDVEFIEQPELLGLGHSIYLTRHTFTSEPLLIILGDTIFQVALGPVIAGRESSLGVKWVEDPRRFGVVETADGRITRLVEKPQNPATNLALVGLYYIANPALLSECLGQLVEGNPGKQGEYQLTDALQMMIDRGEPFTTFPVEGWYDCGKPETLLATNRHLLQQQSSVVALEGCIINPPVHIAPGARVRNSIIGPFATVAEGAVVGNAMIENSIIGENATVEGVALADSIIGPEAEVKGEPRRVNIGASSELNLG